MLQNVLTGQELKTHIGYFIADANLPFSIIERSSFINLLGACNENVPQIMVKADAIQNHIFRMYAQHRELIKIILSKVEAIAVTSDAWTSPNVKSLMALTAHWIDTNWKMQDLLLGVPAVMGKCILLIAWVLMDLTTRSLSYLKQLCLQGSNLLKILQSCITTFCPTMTSLYPSLPLLLTMPAETLLWLELFPAWSM